MVVQVRVCVVCAEFGLFCQWCMLHGAFSRARLCVCMCGVLNLDYFFSGAWCMVHDAWCMVHGAWCMVHGAFSRALFCEAI